MISVKTLTSCTIETPLGTMIAIADEHALYLLDFIDRKNAERQLGLILTKTNAIIVPGSNAVLDSITQELTDYFAGKLTSFTTPIQFTGSPFQHGAWNMLTTVPYGQTRTYLQEAVILGNKNACRAVARANSTNNLAIIVPCHRIIGSNGKLTGYAGGVDRKEWLINHEKQHIKALVFSTTHLF